MPRRPESWLIASNHLQERSPASACTRRLVTLASGCACGYIRESANPRERSEALQPRGRKWGAASGCRRASSVSFSFCPVSFRPVSTKDEGWYTQGGSFRGLGFGLFFLNLLRILESYYRVCVWVCLRGVMKRDKVCLNVWNCLVFARNCLWGFWLVLECLELFLFSFGFGNKFYLLEIFRKKFVEKLCIYIYIYFFLSLDKSERFKDSKNDIGSKNQ